MLIGLIKSFKRTTEYRFENKVPENMEIFLKQVGLLRRFLKFTIRYCFYFFQGHKNLEVNKIEEEQKRILWINISAPSLGDALMDLSSRVILKNKELDLLTDKRNAELFQYDKHFRNVYTTESVDIKNHYDLVILDSFSTRSLKIKYQYARNVLFVGMYGFFNGCDVNRTLYSFYQMNYLLGLPYNENQINKIAKPHLDLNMENFETLNENLLPKKFLSIALGGDWLFRTYNNWEFVIEKIFSVNSETKILILGSKNALSLAQKIQDKFGENVVSYVNKLSFLETSKIIGKSELLLCCDGGLMHAAHSLNIPTISLFAKVKPELRLTNKIKNISIYDSSDVNNIKPSEIFEKYLDFYPLL